MYKKFVDNKKIYFTFLEKKKAIQNVSMRKKTNYLIYRRALLKICSRMEMQKKYGFLHASIFFTELMHKTDLSVKQFHQEKKKW